MDIVELYVIIDNFCKKFMPKYLNHNKRTNSHKLFSGIAKIGKSTMGWFFGFKLHITCDTSGNLTSMAFTRGNTDDRNAD